MRLQVFPAPHRGTGESICSSLNWLAGILAPVIQIATKSAEGETGSATANAYVPRCNVRILDLTKCTDKVYLRRGLALHCYCIADGTAAVRGEFVVGFIARRRTHDAP